MDVFDIHEKMEGKSTSSMIISFIIFALAFNVSLVWNDAMKSFIDVLIPQLSDSLIYRLITAIAVTSLSVMIINFILKAKQKVSDKNDKKDSQKPEVGAGLEQKI